MSKLTPEEVLQAIKDGKKVEYLHTTQDGWCELVDCDFTIENLLDGFYTYRLAQEMITVAGIEFPKPEATKLDKDTKYYYPKPTYIDLYDIAHWSDSWLDKFKLSANMIHLTKENAIAHAKALIKLSGGNYE